MSRAPRLRRLVAVSACTAVLLSFAATAAASGGEAALRPPVGVLTIDGAGPYRARNGSFCVRQHGDVLCGDAIAPSTPPRAIAGRDALRIHLGDGWRIDRWHITSRPYSDDLPQPGPRRLLSKGRSEQPDGQRSLRFQGPHTGDRRLEAFVEFHGPDGRGDVTLHWRLIALPSTDSAIGAEPEDGTSSGSAAAMLGLPILLGLASPLLWSRFRRRDR